MLSSNAFLGDVAAVYNREIEAQAFGSGRLIAPGLVLTARHVVEFVPKSASRDTGWNVRLIADRAADGSWAGEPRESRVVWRSSGPADLALLQLVQGQTAPTLKPIFAKYDLQAPLPVDTAGFPEARWDTDSRVHEYTLRGMLRITEQHGPLTFSVSPADKPDNPLGWRGISGAAIARADRRNRLHIFGVLQHVPANFSGGQLAVARLQNAFDDRDFVRHLAVAAGAFPHLRSWTHAPLPLAQSLASVLKRQVQGCRQRDVKFRSPHIIAALFQLTPSFARECFNQAKPGTDREVQRLVDMFIAHQETSPSERGYEPQAIEENPLIRRAEELAADGPDLTLNERHLLLAFLESNSGFLKKLTEALGRSRLAEVKAATERMRPRREVPAGTDVSILK